ncbi:MAG: adventurous gliding motility protein GltC [Archangium sp.]|nr:adventurous gliding motility protein GltC [Archangium sp.]
MRLRTILVLAVLGFATPALAQFEGLDLGPKKKGGKKGNGKKGNGKKDEKKDDKTDDKKDDKGSGEVPLPEGGLDLSKPPVAEDKPKDSKPAATMSFEAVDVSGKTGDRQKMDAAITQFKNDAFEPAALAFFDMSQDPNMAGLSTESQYWLAKSLYKLGMYHSSLQNFSKVLAKGPSTKFFKSSLEWLFFIARKTVNETVVLDEIARYSNYEFPERFRNEFRYLLARYNLVRGKALDEAEQTGEATKAFDEVKRLSLMIPRGDAFYARAKYLEGLAYFREGKLETALETMKEVVRATRTADGPITAEGKQLKALRELAFMQLARTHYGARQNRYAIFYFSKIERGGVQWLESLFEASWAHYRIGQYEQALGNLITLSSPFFRDEYFPEALILKAVVYYENCRYTEALTIIEDFENIYGPVQEELDVLVNKNMEATEYFNVLDEVRKKNKVGQKLKGTDEILERILNLALTDTDLKKTVDSIAELEGEMDAIGTKGDTFKYSNLSKAVIEQLKAQRQTLVTKAGLMAKAKLDFELGQLKTLRANGLRIKFETTSKEKEFLEEMLQAGGKNAIVKKYKYRTDVSDDQLYWPYVGEYWRDELGTYQYTLTKGCIERDSANQKKE